MRYVIRKIPMAHCKRGPKRCEKCREMDYERVCLLDTEPEDAGMVQRRVVDVTVDGETAWREFDILRVFADEEEALTYAREHGIESVEGCGGSH